MLRWMQAMVLAWVVALAGPCALAALLSRVAETWRGHLFGLVGVAVSLAPAVWGLGVARARHGLRRAGTVLGALAMVGTAVLVGSVPTARPPSSAGAWSEGPRSLGLPTLLPEVDQLILGTYLAALVDPILTARAAGHLRATLLSVYRPMAHDADFASLPTQLDEAYQDVARGQRFIYVPPHGPEERLPCVVFLHGSAGNFQGYLWVWKRLADRGRFVVVAPGFGFGNWQRRGGVEAVRAARREAERTLPVDPSRFILAGLSNGGRGVMRVIEDDPALRWRAVVLLSAVVDLEPTPAAWTGRPTLVIHGLEDDRITKPWLDEAVRALRAAGAAVETRFDPEADHFLFFTKPEEIDDWVLKFLAPWLVSRSAGAAHPPATRGSGSPRRSS